MKFDDGAREHRFPRAFVLGLPAAVVQAAHRRRRDNGTSPNSA
jgi:hypothetical protein